MIMQKIKQNSNKTVLEHYLIFVTDLIVSVIFLRKSAESSDLGLYIIFHPYSIRKYLKKWDQMTVLAILSLIVSLTTDLEILDQDTARHWLFDDLAGIKSNSLELMGSEDQDIKLPKLAWYYFGALLNSYFPSNWNQWKSDEWDGMFFAQPVRIISRPVAVLVTISMFV